MRITKQYVNKRLSILVSRYVRFIGNNKIGKAFNCLSAICFIKYKFYIGYKDNWIEDQIQYLGRYIRPTDFVLKDSYAAVFIDSFSLDNRGLTQQYLNALMKGGFSILYIHKRRLDNKSSVIRDSLMHYGKAVLKQIPETLKALELSQWIYDTICFYGAPRIFMHLMPNAIEECVAFSALPKGIVRYQLNLTDHTFWAGKSCMDYSIEFRHYGCNLTLNKREFEKEHIICLPYYPIMDKTIPFDSFPQEARGKFIFLTGGALYKIYDDNNTFFKLCGKILEQCPNAVILYAGANISDTTLMASIAEHNLQGRFIPIGNRRDIYEVFLHCDVYINTYPFGGGLMCQYAAHCSKPILNYLNTSIEEVIGQIKPVCFTSATMKDFVSEAKALYNDKDYRLLRGQQLSSSVVSKDEFDKAFLYSISSNKTFFKISWIVNFIPERLDEEGVYKYVNKSWDFQYTLFKILGIDFFIISPWMFISLNRYRIINKIRKSLK